MLRLSLARPLVALVAVLGAVFGLTATSAATAPPATASEPVVVYIFNYYNWTLPHLDPATSKSRSIWLAPSACFGPQHFYKYARELRPVYMSSIARWAWVTHRLKVSCRNVD